MVGPEAFKLSLPIHFKSVLALIFEPPMYQTTQIFQKVIATYLWAEIKQVYNQRFKTSLINIYSLFVDERNKASCSTFIRYGRFRKHLQTAQLHAVGYVGRLLKLSFILYKYEAFGARRRKLFDPPKQINQNSLHLSNYHLSSLSPGYRTSWAKDPHPPNLIQWFSSQQKTPKIKSMIFKVYEHKVLTIHGEYAVYNVYE